MTLRSVSTGFAALALVGLGWLAACSPGETGWRAAIGPETADRLNVILVTIDTLRADRLGAWGSEVRTPHLDALAAESVRFSNAASTVPFTLPAHSSIMTGTYPAYHGVRENVGYALGTEVPTLAELLVASGYTTAGFVSSFVLDSRWGIARGFDTYFDEFDLGAMEERNMASVQRSGPDTIAEVIRWLDGDHGEAPFFVWMHLFDPHDPYEPPEPFRSQYPGRPYDAEVAYTDSLIGDFRQQLQSRGLLDTSLLIITGDHGEGLGDHGEQFHGYFIYDATVHIPLLVRAPRGVLGAQVADAAVSHVDLLPTVLEATGIAIPEHVQGRSLLPLMLGTDTGDERQAYSESYYPLLHYGWSPLRSLRTREHKYIAAPREELYDLQGDPGEADNVAGTMAATSLALARRLDQLASDTEFGGERELATPDIDDDALRQLRALGYIAGRGELLADDDGDQRADPKDKIRLHQLIMAAQSDVGGGHEDQAEEKLRRVLALDDSVLDANQMVGNILNHRGEPEHAIPFFRRALELDPEHEASLFGLASAYRRLGRSDEALLGFRRLLELNPTDSKTAIAAADLLVERDDLTGATDLLGQVAGERDVPPVVFNRLGELYVLQGQSSAAEGWFERAIEASDEAAQPWFNLAVLHENRGETARARELYGEVIQRTDRHFQALFNLGRLEGMAGDGERQRERWEAAIAANPEFVRGYYLLAKLIMDQGGDLAAAESLARAGLARDEDHVAGPLGYFVLADILNRQGRRAEAIDAARRGQALQGS